MVVKDREKTLESFSFKDLDEQTNNLILKLQFRKTEYKTYIFIKKYERKKVSYVLS